MKRILLTMAAAGLLAGALALPALLRAEGKPGDEKFGISEEQEAKLKAARRAKRDAAEAAHTDMKSAFRTLRDQLEDKAPEKDLAATLDKITAARKAMRAGEEQFEASLRSILTPTQRAMMAVAMQEHGRGHQGKRGRMGGGDHDD